MLRARRADFPILLSLQYFVKPALLDDQRTVCAAFQAAPLARASLRLSCRRVTCTDFPFLDGVYLRLPRCGVALSAEHAASTLIADHAAATAQALALQAVGARAFQEALAAELGAR